MSTSLAPPVSTENDPHDSMPSYGAALSWADKVLADIKRDVEAPKEAAEAHGLGPSAPDLSASEKPDSPTLHVKPSELMARDPASLDFGWHRDDFVAAKPEASPKAPATDTPSQNWPPRLDWPPPVDIAPGSASNFKIEPIVEKRPKSRWMGRTAVGFLFALVSAMAAASWPHYGGKIKQSLAEWTPPAMISSLGKINAAGRSAPSPSPTMVGSAAAAAPADQAEQPSSASQGAASAQPASSSSPAVESASSGQSSSSRRRSPTSRPSRTRWRAISPRQMKPGPPMRPPRRRRARALCRRMLRHQSLRSQSLLPRRGWSRRARWARRNRSIPRRDR